MKKSKRYVKKMEKRFEDVTPELDSKAYAELKNNKH